MECYVPHIFSMRFHHIKQSAKRLLPLVLNNKLGLLSKKMAVLPEQTEHGSHDSKASVFYIDGAISVSNGSNRSVILTKYGDIYEIVKDSVSRWSSGEQIKQACYVKCYFDKNYIVTKDLKI